MKEYRSIQKGIPEIRNVKKHFLKDMCWVETRIFPLISDKLLCNERLTMD